MLRHLLTSYPFSSLHGKFGFDRFTSLPLEIRRLIYKYAIYTELEERSYKLARDHGIYEVQDRPTNVAKENDFKVTNSGCADFMIDVVVYMRLAQTRKFQFSQRKREEVAKYPLFLPMVCKVTEQTFQEALTVFVSECEFVVREYRAGSCLRKLLARVHDENGFKAVRELRFPNFGYFKGLDTHVSNRDMDLMARCTGLRRLVVGIHTDMLDHRTDGSYGASGDSNLKIKTLKDLVEYYQWEKIFACTCLRDICINCTYTEDEDAGDLKKLVEAMAEWLGGEFERRNDQIVKVVIDFKEGRKDAEVL
jgi:hypothetical protein